MQDHEEIKTPPEEPLLDEETNFDYASSPASAEIAESVIIDLVDACNGACATCVRGVRYMKNKAGQMDFDLFRKIMDKVAKLGFHWVSLFNWSDPFLCKNLSRYAAYVKEKGMNCQLSSNLSYRNIPELIPALKYTDELIVSVSGFYQDTYRINHRGGNIEHVKANLKKISEAKKSGLISTDVYVYYFHYPYSLPEWPLFKDFALELGLKAKLWRGHGDPLSGADAMREYIAGMEQRASVKMEKGFFASSSVEIMAPDFKTCYSASYPTVIDSYGNAHLCPRVANTEATKVGNFLDDDFDVLQYRRMAHPLCAQCQSKSPIQIAPSHLACLMRGMFKQQGYNPASMFQMDKDAQKAEELKGKDVIFWGFGEMFWRKCHVFADCNPKYIVSDLTDLPGSISDIPVAHPDAVLPNEPSIPIIIFAGKTAGEQIRQKIMQKYPHHDNIYICTEDESDWPDNLHEYFK